MIEAKRAVAMAIPPLLDIGTFDEFLLHPERGHEEPGSIWLRGEWHVLVED